MSVLGLSGNSYRDGSRLPQVVGRGPHLAFTTSLEVGSKHRWRSDRQVNLYRSLDPLSEVRRCCLRLQFRGGFYTIGIDSSASPVRGVLHYLCGI